MGTKIIHESVTPPVMVLINDSMQAIVESTKAAETFTDANWATYFFSPVRLGTISLFWSFDLTGLPAGVYLGTVYDLALPVLGTNQASAKYSIAWDGSAIITAASIDTIETAAVDTVGKMPAQGPVASYGNVSNLSTLTQGQAQTAAEAAIVAKLPSGETEIAAAGATAKTLDAVDGGGGTQTPLDQQPVPASRTVKMVRKGAGLVGERTLTVTSGELQLIAVDFYGDMPTHGRITLAAATETGGPLLGTITEGQDRSKAKLSFTPTATGTATLSVVVTYADGGGQAEGVLTLTVV